MFSPELCALFGAPPAGAESRSPPSISTSPAACKGCWRRSFSSSARPPCGDRRRETSASPEGWRFNCVANGRIRRAGAVPFRLSSCPPAAGDSGGALGAAALAHLAVHRLASRARAARARVLGTLLDRADEIAPLLAATGLPVQDFRRARSRAAGGCGVDRLVAGQVVGWFHGRWSTVHAPSAPAACSPIRANPSMRRPPQPAGQEARGPSAPSRLASLSDPGGASTSSSTTPSPFMLETCAVCSPLALPPSHPTSRRLGPAHRPSIRAAAPRSVLACSRPSPGAPAARSCHTSFNVMGEPIVGDPARRSRARSAPPGSTPWCWKTSSRKTARRSPRAGPRAFAALENPRAQPPLPARRGDRAGSVYVRMRTSPPGASPRPLSRPPSRTSGRGER